MHLLRDKTVRHKYELRGPRHLFIYFPLADCPVRKDVCQELTATSPQPFLVLRLPDFLRFLLDLLTQIISLRKYWVFSIILYLLFVAFRHLLTYQFQFLLKLRLEIGDLRDYLLNS